MTVFRGNTFWMELYAVHWERAMDKPHDQTIVCFRSCGQLWRQALSLDHERMVAGGSERAGNTAKHSLAVVPDVGKLSVHQDRCTHDVAAERLSDRLMAETDAEDGNAGRCLSYERK